VEISHHSYWRARRAELFQLMDDLPLGPAHEKLIDESVWNTGKMIVDTLPIRICGMALGRLKCTSQNLSMFCPNADALQGCAGVSAAGHSRPIRDVRFASAFPLLAIGAAPLESTVGEESYAATSIHQVASRVGLNTNAAAA
jgi:hypothetical protein